MGPGWGQDLYSLFPIPYFLPAFRGDPLHATMPAMRWKLLSVLLALVALGTAPWRCPLTRSPAQDGTPPLPAGVRRALPHQPPAPGETFDTAAGWLPDGLWRFEASAERWRGLARGRPRAGG